MAIIKCKMCGGDLNIIENASTAECEYCGSVQTVPKVDDEKKLTLFARANRLRAGCDFDKAAGIYESIVADFPEEAEAYWGLVLCKYGIEYVDDPATGKKIPTCHRSSYDSVMDDGNFDQAMENADVVAQKVYRDEAKQLERIRKGILEVSSAEEPYDIFICYKETAENGDRTLDSVLAQDLYSALTDKGYRVFFSRITLQGKLGEAYEPYIFAALNSAKVMLAVGTSYEYYNAVWVKNEWSRYLKICAADKSKHLIPCYKDLDPEDMPREFNHLQGADLGKMGAVQDILFNMEKYIPLKKTEVVVQERVVVGTPNNNASPLLKRGNMALEDGEWSRADEFFEEVLNQDAECAEAYLGKFLAYEEIATLDNLVEERLEATQYADSDIVNLPPQNARVEASVEKYQIPNYLWENGIRNLYPSHEHFRYWDEGTTERTRQLSEEEEFWADNKQLSRALRFAKGDFANRLNSAREQVFGEMRRRLAEAEAAAEKSKAEAENLYEESLAKADKEAANLYEKALARREADYRALCGEMDVAQTAEDFEAVAKKLSALAGYLDSGARAQTCHNKANELFAERARQKALQEKEETYLLLAAKAEHQENPEKLFDLSQKLEGLGDYKDSAKLAAQYREKAETLVEEQKRREIAEARQRAKRKKRNTIITVIILLLASAAATFYFVILPEMNYRKAEELLSAGQYDAAIAAFEELEDYKDASDRISEAKYRQAEALLAAEQYDEAIAAFESAIVYGDARDRIHEANYKKAEAFLASEKYGEAAILFGRASGYQDAKARSMKLWNQIADRETISVGSFHTVALKADGTVVATGDNDYGRCNVDDWTDIAAVSAGANYTVGLKADGTVVTNGSPYYKSSMADWADIVAVSAGAFHSIGLKADGTVVAAGNNGNGQCNVGDWTDIVAISACEDYTVGLKSNGTVDTRGIYMPSIFSWADIVAISAGANHAVGLKADGTVVAVGDNGNGQCNVGDWTDIVAVSAGDDYTVGLKADGTVVAVGDNGDVGDWTDIVAISAGDYHTVGLKSDGTVIATGYNAHGQCNVSGWTSIKVPQ